MAGNGGEDRRRRQAVDEGAPIPAPNQCPVKLCKSNRIMRHGSDSKLARAIAAAWGSSVRVPIDQCRECFSIWEPWPDDDPGAVYRDIVECDPCPNCAYRAGSPESKDREEWARLKSLVVDAAAAGPLSTATAKFCCHRGVPIKVDDDGIRFDFEAADVDPLQQTCVGFLRALWRRNGAAAAKKPGEC